MGRNWRGIGLRLLLLVLAITWLAEGIKLHRSINAFARNDFPGVIQDFPPITIKDGVVSSPVDQPYTMKDQKTGKAFAVLDTTGEITSLDQTDADILLTENKLIYRDNKTSGQTKIQDLSHIKNLYVDRARVTNWMDVGARWFAVIAVPICFFFTFLYRLIQSLLYAAIGLIWNNSFNAKLSYAALMRLSCVAVTPVILLETVLTMCGVHVPFWGTLCGLIAMIYLAIAVKANAQPYEPYGYGDPQFYPPQQQPFPAYPPPPMSPPGPYGPVPPQ